ncbi:MAG: Gfo/Idh/MocA family oxidoreductase [bacterium]|nr:Gfo/Idh/MocA family oxidoreductase [bacterium]
MVRVGFVGLGHNGVAHVEAHRRVGKSEVVALCDTNPARLQEVSEQFGVSRTYATAEALCANEDVDAVSIHTGDPYHVEPFAAAVRNGKHVLVEKPLANSVEEVEAIVRVAQEADQSLKLAVGYILRFNPVFEAIHRLCVDGRLGKVYYMEGDYIHNLLYQANQTDAHTGVNWYLESERPVVGGGSHPLDLLRWFSGAEVVEVMGYSNHVAFPEMKNDDCQVGMFRFNNGAVAKVAALYAPRRDGPLYYNLRLYGTMGTVERDQAAIAKDEADVHPAFEAVEADRVKGHPYDPEVEDWLDAIVEDRTPRCDVFDGANSTVATLVAAEAMSQGKTLSVPVYRRA